MEDKIFIDGEEYRYIELKNKKRYVNKNGILIDAQTMKLCKTRLKEGYLYSGNIALHLFVAHAWVDGYFEGAEVNHKDFDRKNCNADNLEWLTHKENIEYTIKYNYLAFCNSKIGIKNGRARFTEEEVLMIREMYENGNSIADIVKYFYPELKTSKQYKSIHSTFANIVHRKTWKHL